jgi:hypothetical protein
MYLEYPVLLGRGKIGGNVFIHFGTPKRLGNLGITCPEIRELKSRIQIAVIDDDPFIKLESLRAHGFSITELGGDIKSVDQVMAYPIVICDIKGVGKAFGSDKEGAHVLSEIRKSYPDKFLITFTGMTYDASYNESLATTDASATKDASIDYWTALLEKGLKNVGDPRQRWVRFRKNLLDEGMDLFELFKLEQAFISSIEKRDPSIMKSHPVPAEVKDIVVKFTVVALIQILEGLGKS